MIKNKSDIESLFGKLLESSNAFNTINTFNEGAKDIFKNKNFKIEDLGEKLNDVINSVGNTIDSNIEKVKDKVFEENFLEDSKAEEIKPSQEEIEQYNKIKEQIINELSNIEKNSYILDEDNTDFKLQDIAKKLNSNKVKEAIILSEILGKPLSRRKRNRNRGYR